MSERIVYWKALADFSQLRREAKKTEQSIKSLRREVDKANASNADLGESEDHLARDTKKSSQEVSSALSRVAAAQKAAREETNKSAAAKREEAAASRAANIESARSAKAMQAERAAVKSVEAANQRLTSARNDHERATQRVARAENELSKALGQQVKDAKAIEAANQRVTSARDHEARTIDRVNQASAALSQTQGRLRAVQASNALESRKAADALARAEDRRAKATEAAAAKEVAAAKRVAAQQERTAKAAEAAAARRVAAAERVAQREARAVRDTIARNERLASEYARLAAAKNAADNAIVRTGPARSLQSPELNRANNAISSRPATLQTRTQVESANALARAQNTLRAAIENENAAFVRLNATERDHSVALSNLRTAEHQAMIATANHGDAVAKYGESSLQALKADQERLTSQRNVARSSLAVTAAETARVRASEAVRQADTRVTNASTGLGAALRRVEKDFRINTSSGNGFFRVIGKIATGFDNFDNKVTKAAGNLRHLFWPGLFAGAAILIASLSSLVSGLFALASAVSPAVGALAAAIPVTYALAGAFAAVRAAFGGIGGVLKAYQQEQIKAAAGGARAAKQEADNADQIKSAQQSLADARENVGVTARNVADQIEAASRQVIESDRAQIEAQRQLSQARKDAKRNIDDLKNAVIDAALAEKGAMLDVADAQDNLQRVMNDPNASRSDRDRARLQVDVAKQSAKEAAQATRDSQHASEQATARGVEGDQGVVAARRALADANYQAAQAQRKYNESLVDGARDNRKALQSVADAQRALVKAQRDAATSSDAATTAANTYQAKLSMLSPAAQKFVKHLISMRHYWLQLKATAAGNLFPGLTKALDKLPKLFPIFNDGIGGISRELGNLAVKFANLITTPRWISSFKQLNAASVPLLKNIGGAVLNVLDALRAVGTSAIPLAKQLTKGIQEWTANLDKAARAGEKSGRLAKFFDHTYVVLHQLGQVFRNLITTIYNVGRASSASGQDTLDSILAITDKWKRWTGSPDGQGKMRKFFAEVRENMKQVDGLLGSVLRGFLKMGASKNLSPILGGLRDIGSAIKQAFSGQNGLGKTFADLLHNIADIIRAMSENSAGLKVFLSVLNGFAQILSTFLGFKPVAYVLGALLAGFAAFKALKFIGAITGLTSFGKALYKFRQEAKLTGGVMDTLKRKFSKIPLLGRLTRGSNAPDPNRPLPGPRGGNGSPGPRPGPGSGGPRPTPGGGPRPTPGGAPAPRPVPGPIPYPGYRPMPGSGAPVRPLPPALAGGGTGRPVPGPVADPVVARQAQRAGRTGLSPTPIRAADVAGAGRGPIVLRQGQSVNLRTGQVTEDPRLPGAGARGPVPGEQARGGLRGRLPRGDAGFINYGAFGRRTPRAPGTATPPRQRRVSSGRGRGIAGAAGAGIGIAGTLLGDAINDHRGGVRQAVGGTLSGAGTGALIGSAFGPWGAAIGAGLGAITGFLNNSKAGKKIKAFFVKDVLPFLKKTVKVIGDVLKAIWDTLEWAWDHVGKPIWNVIETSVKVAIDVITTTVSVLSDIFKAIWDTLKWAWDHIGKPIWEAIKTGIKIVVGIVKVEIAIWKAIFKGAWDTLKWAWDHVGKPIFSVVKGAIKLVSSVFKAEVSFWKSIFKGAWDGLKWAWDHVGKPIVDTVKRVFNTLSGAIGSAFSAVGTVVKNAWEGIERIFASVVNFVTQDIINPLITAINWVITKFGLDPIKHISKITVGSSSGGGKPNLGGSRGSSGRATSAADGNVIPGYSPGSDTRTFVDQHGYRLKLSGGEGILTPETTRAIGGPAGVDALNAAHSPRLRQKPRFKRALRDMGAHADGGFVGSQAQRDGAGAFQAWRAFKNFKSQSDTNVFEDVWGGIKAVGSDAWHLIRKGAAFLIKKGFQGLEYPIRALVDHIPGNNKFIPGLVNGLFDKVNKSVYDFIAGTGPTKKKKDPTKVDIKSARYRGNITGQDARNDVMLSGLVLNNKLKSADEFKSLAQNNRAPGAWAGMMSALQTIIQNESGWNADSINRTDSNAKAGHPSQGLMQTIPSTYAAYKNPNFDYGIRDGISNVTAGIGYSDSRYGGVTRVPGVLAVNQGKPYVGYGDGGVFQAFHTGGVVRGLNKKSSASNAMSALITQAGVGFPTGPRKWSYAMARQISQRLRGVDKAHDVANSSVYPTAVSPLSGDSKTTQALMAWVDKNDPKTYTKLWENQPYGRSDSFENVHHANPLLPILSYLGNTTTWKNYRKNKETKYWNDLASRDNKDTASSGKKKGSKVNATAAGHANIESVKRFIHTADNKPYVFGAVGPSAYDCSGLTGEVWARLTGHPSYRRYFSTREEGRFFKPGKGDGLFTVGFTNNSNEEHTAGRLDGLGFEARSSQDGIIVGSAARRPESFAKVMHLPAKQIKGVKTASSKQTKLTATDEKKLHPGLVKKFAQQAKEWGKDLRVVNRASRTEKNRILALRKALGLSGAGSNKGLYSSDMVNPVDHAMAHALGKQHPADWQHPWSGPVTDVESALADQDRSNALNAEWTKDLNILAQWGLSHLVDYLLEKGITDGMSVARAAIKDKKTATQLDKSIAAQSVTSAGSPSAQILQIIAKLGGGSRTKPFGLRDISSYLNVPDYAVVNLYDQMLDQLKKLPSQLTSKFMGDVDLFRKGLFYANRGAIVPGDKSQDRDIVPAMLTPGESVLSRYATKMLGEHNVNRLNSGVPMQFLNSGGIALAPQISSIGLGSAANMIPNARAVVAGARNVNAMGPATVNLNTTINNPSREESVYSINKNLRRQAALGVVHKAAGK